MEGIMNLSASFSAVLFLPHRLFTSLVHVLPWQSHAITADEVQDGLSTNLKEG